MWGPAGELPVGAGGGHWSSGRQRSACGGHSGGRAIFDFTCGSCLPASAKCPGGRLSAAVPCPRATSHRRLRVPSDVRSWLAAPGFLWNGQKRYLSNNGNFSPFRSDLFFNSFDAECHSYPRGARAWAFWGHRPHQLLLCCSHGGWSG